MDKSVFLFVASVAALDEQGTFYHAVSSLFLVDAPTIERAKLLAERAAYEQAYTLWPEGRFWGHSVALARVVVDDLSGQRE